MVNNYDRVDLRSVVPGLTVTRLVHKLLPNLIDYPDYRFIKTFAQYDKDDAIEFNMRLKNTALQLKDKTFSGKTPVSVIVIFSHSRLRVMPAMVTTVQPSEVSSTSYRAPLMQ